MADSNQTIANLIFTYADRIDHGHYAGIEDLFAHAEITAEAMDDPVRGRDAVVAMYTNSTRIYEDTGNASTASGASPVGTCPWISSEI